MKFNLKGNNFLVLGRAGMDFYADPPGTKLELANRFVSALGGSAANISAAIARLGGGASLISAVSDDAVGRFILNQLRHYGIGTDYLGLVSGQFRSSLAVVETRNDNCQNVIYRNAAADFELTEAALEAVQYSNFDALILTGTALAKEPSRSASLKLIALARQAGLAIILDLDYRPYSWASAAEASSVGMTAVTFSDLIVGNDVEFDVLAKGKSGQACAMAIAQQGKTVVYKMGEKGAVTYARNLMFGTPIFPVTALKPTGAGDSFMGAMVTGLAAGLSMEQAVRRGAAAAAIVVSRVGCAPAMPTPAELDSFLQTGHVPQQAG
jgi:5-dehydro-2-deoxygluconokinase